MKRTFITFLLMAKKNHEEKSFIDVAI